MGAPSPCAPDNASRSDRSALALAMAGGTSCARKVSTPIGALRHLVVQPPCRVVGLSQELRASRANLGEATDGRAGVVHVAARGAPGGGLEQPFACRAVAQRSQQRLLRRVDQGQNPSPIESSRNGRGRCVGDIDSGQSVEFGRVVHDQRTVSARREQFRQKLGARASPLPR